MLPFSAAYSDGKVGDFGLLSNLNSTANISVPLKVIAHSLSSNVSDGAEFQCTLGINGSTNTVNIDWKYANSSMVIIYAVLLQILYKFYL